MAVTLKFQSVGTDQLAEKLKQRALAIDERVNKVGVKWSQDEVQKLQNEPPPPPLPNQRYKRTGRYADAFTAFNTRINNWGIRNRVKALRTGVKYPVFVGGDGEGKGQVDIHQNRWPLNRKTVEDAIPRLVTMIRLKVSDIVNGRI